MNLSSSSNSKWAGKKWACVGDSITQGISTTITYHQIIANEIGVNNLNYGVSGTGWRTGYPYGSNNAFYQRLGSIDSTSDLITVFGGTNDYTENAVGMVLGTMGDTSATASFYGAVDTVLSSLVTNFPTKTIAVFTPTQRKSAWYNLSYSASTKWAASTVYSVGNQITPNAVNGHSYICTTAGTSGTTEPVWTTTSGATQPTDGTVAWKELGADPTNVTLQDISTAIITVANKYNIPVLDLYKNGNMYPQNSTFVSTYMDAQGLHPNAAGHKILADKILAFLNAL